FRIVGVTVDKYAIVFDNTTSSTKAINLTSGASQTIATGQLTGLQALVWSNTAVVFHDPSPDGLTSHVTAWTAAGGVHELSAHARVDFRARMSSDGTRIAFWDHVDAATDALTVDDPTHASAHTLVSAAAGCSGVIRVLSVGAPRIVASYCTPGGTVPGGQGVVTAFNLTTSTATTLQTGAQLSVQVDSSGTRAVVRALGNLATIVTLDGATRLPLDSSFSQGQWFRDGVELMYVAGGALKRICSGGQPEVIQPSGVGGLFWLSI